VMAWYYDGFATAEIATMVNRPEATVRSHLRHARQRLQRELTVRNVAAQNAAAAGEGNT